MQTQIYMSGNKAEPRDGPRQPQIIDKGSPRAKPVPSCTATKPRRSSRTKAGPQAPLTTRDRQATTRTMNRQVIGSKLNKAKHASRQRITSLIKTQLIIDKATQPPTKTNNKTTHKHRDTTEKPIFTHHIPCPKSKRTPAPVTQEETELQPTAAVATKNASLKLDRKNYGKISIDPPLAGTYITGGLKSVHG